tara:strand:- start:623 stop:964 length:342 start_codon:yes stop_codon:yes gene_type:complete
MIRFKRKRKTPKYTGPTPEQAAEQARKAAEEAAAKVRAENEAAMKQMQSKLDAVRKAQGQTFKGSNLGSQQKGLSRKGMSDKKKKAMKTSKTKISLDPAALTYGSGGSGETQL